MLQTDPSLVARCARLALAASIAASMLTAPQASARERERSAPSCRLRVHAVESESPTLHQSARIGHGPSRFSAYETSMLEFDLLCRGDAPIAERTRVDLHLPDGELYRTLTMSRIEAERPSSKRRRWQLWGSVRFPVRGTFVTQNGLFGEWSAKLCREVGSRVTCDAGVAFDLDKE